MSSAALALDTPRLSIADFFNGLLPAIVDLRRATAATISGRVCVMVQGEGAWVITFGRNPTVEEGIDFDADLVATFSAHGFARLLAGETLDPDAGEPACFGDTTLLTKLGRLLVEPAKGALGARLSHLTPSSNY